jgi:hypothetical protein
MLSEVAWITSHRHLFLFVTFKALLFLIIVILDIIVVTIAYLR